MVVEVVILIKRYCSIYLASKILHYGGGSCPFTGGIGIMHCVIYFARKFWHCAGSYCYGDSVYLSRNICPCFVVVRVVVLVAMYLVVVVVVLIFGIIFDFLVRKYGPTTCFKIHVHMLKNAWLFMHQTYIL